MPRPIEARIDLAALRHNYLVAKRHAGAARAWAVVKANAYGHGLLRAAAALGEVADGFALLDLDEAIILREAGIRQPILLLEGFFAAADLEICATYGLSVVIHRLEQLQMLRHAALKVPLPIYLKLDSGMHRLGFSCEQIPAARRELTALATAVAPAPVTLMTHFAEADAVGGECCINWQLERFARMLADWPEATSLPISVANSAAIGRQLGRHPALPADRVCLGTARNHALWWQPVRRSGGREPRPQASDDAVAVQEIGVGERVGYGGTFVAQRPTRVGVVACGYADGYADGYPRHAPSGTPILVAGEQTQTLGRVSMDMLACDLTDLPGTGVGSPVVLWGQGLPADAVAAAAQTISYELFCALARRVPVVEI